MDVDPGSYRDPRGQVYLQDGKIFRTITQKGIEDFEKVRDSGLLDALVKKEWLVDYQPSDQPALTRDPSVKLVLEHAPIPFISYPYEWSFELLKSAALLQLDIYLEALEYDLTLSDASAYNVQFVGPKPIFIDHLSFKPYKDSEFWGAHRQFCEQFLNPLLLRSKVGITHNAWYRGSLEGVATSDLNSLLPMKSKFSWQVFSHVSLQARFQADSLKNSRKSTARIGKGLPRKSFENILRSMRDWIAVLQPLHGKQSVWGDYESNNSYTDESGRQKKEFVQKVTSSVEPEQLWDIGCNMGEYSKTALQNGAKYVVGFDLDHTALDLACDRALTESLNFLPLFLDLSNPTPNQGWRYAERKSVEQRSKCDCLLALALVHHLAIAKNIPLPSLIGWLVSLAPEGVIEFVPKSDPMVQELLRFREDIFDDYSIESFQFYLKLHAQVVRSEAVIGSDRVLFWYSRTSAK